jgi:hypothetical protein
MGAPGHVAAGQLLCSRIIVQVVLEGFRLWKFDAAAFQSRGNKDLLAVRVGSRNPDG